MIKPFARALPYKILGRRWSWDQRVIPETAGSSGSQRNWPSEIHQNHRKHVGHPLPTHGTGSGRRQKTSCVGSHREAMLKQAIRLCFDLGQTAIRGATHPQARIHWLAGDSNQSGKLTVLTVQPNTAADIPQPPQARKNPSHCLPADVSLGPPPILSPHRNTTTHKPSQRTMPTPTTTRGYSTIQRVKRC